MSTDVVFGGRAAPYTERDHPTPATPYGRHKFAAERSIGEIHPGAVIVRTSLIYGTDRPSPAQHQLAELLRSPAGPPSMRWFTDEYRCPVHADDLAAAVSDLAGRPDVSGPLHVTGPERVSRAAFADLMARYIGVTDAGLPTTTLAESGLDRPGNVVLDVSKAADLGITCRPVSTVLA
jgi:dTDP-4-dehydrorhamnose reductase